MLGHQLLKSLAPNHEVGVTLREDASVYAGCALFGREDTYFGVDVRSTERLLEVLADFKPQWIVNAIGIVKQRREAKERTLSIEINALLPHRLAMMGAAIGARLIHLSTDCVFSGRKGSYREGDASDADDVYGKTKYLGEVSGEKCLTLRTSIIGRELSRRTALLEWFLAQTGPVKGYRRAIFSGFTTIEMSRIIEMMMTRYPNASGVYQVSSDPINKFELLGLFRERLNHRIPIEPDDEFLCDRSLDSSRFRREFTYQPPSWEDMIEELKEQL
jgi:dTDP-4-dehydrorhamnose reductase